MARNKIAKKVYDAQRRREITEFLRRYKLEAGCVDCGYRADAVALDFDHRDPSMKRFKIGQSAGRSLREIVNEIAKCDVRCANCHRIRTEHGQK